MTEPTLEELHEENRRCYEADVHTDGYERSVQASNARYIPALEARVEELELALIEARNPGIDMDEVRRTREARR